MTMIKAIDLFSGGGGVSIGLTQAGFKIACAVEIDKDAVKAYKGYHLLKDVSVIERDICEISGAALLKTARLNKNALYLLAGCPPCQKFSLQNRINNLDEDNIGYLSKIQGADKPQIPTAKEKKELREEKNNMEKEIVEKHKREAESLYSYDENKVNSFGNKITKSRYI